MCDFGQLKLTDLALLSPQTKENVPLLTVLLNAYRQALEYSSLIRKCIRFQEYARQKGLQLGGVFAVVGVANRVCFEGLLLCDSKWINKRYFH